MEERRTTTKLGAGLAAALALGVAAASGCGNDRPPAGDGIIGPGSTSGGGTRDAGGTQPRGCGSRPDGSYCECLDVPLYADPPNMYFVLDHSGSMSDDDKWETVRTTVGSVVRAIGPRANFGAAWYPNVIGDDTCASGSEIMSLRPGDQPMNGADGPTTRWLMLATQPPPFGGTPTAPTLTSLFPKIKGYPGKTFVIVATDGGPNCNAATTCTVDKCIPNIENYQGCPTGGAPNCCDGEGRSCLDGAASVSAIAAYASAGIPVYVVGIPGSAPYASVLDQMAVAGGTALATSPRYYRVDTASSTDLLATLKKVAAKIIATCEFKLKTAPADPSLVNVYLDEVPVPQADSWTLAGDTVTLVGATCNRVLAGEVLDVRIITGCPTIIR